jgi:hypothetical protein
MANDDSMAWQRQSMSKNGGSSAPSQMNSKLMPSGPAAGLHSKIAAPTHGMGGLISSANPSMKKPVARFADGTDGEVDVEQLKQEGLAASAKDAPVGFWKRLTQGNIDDPKSEAYQEYGAGRGQRERNAKALSDESADIAKTTAKVQADDAAKADMKAKYPDTEFGDLEGAMKRAKEAPEPKAAPAASKTAAKTVAAKPSAPASKPAETSKPSAPAAPSTTKASAPAVESVVQKKSEPAKSFAEDVAERKRNLISSSAALDVNYGHEGNRPLPEKQQQPKTRTYRGLDGKVRKYGE